jgi:acyl-CoA synthetase (NDP forming)
LNLDYAYNRSIRMNSQNNLQHRTDSFWHALFSADSIAVIGAKDVPGSWGLDAMRAAVASAKVKKGRRVYAVNPNCSEVLGIKCHDTILDINETVDLAIIVVPAAIVPQVFKQCAEKKVKAAVIVSAGFAEVDEEGARLEAEVVAIARKAGIHFVGPNCIGHADLHSHVASAGVAGMIPPGPLALLSQSGTLGASIMQTAAGRGIGLSKLVSTGNEADLHLEDYLEYMAQDDNTKVIAAYIEGLREGRRFYNLAKEITTRKPIVVMKSGTTGESAKAARSHTGALAGSDEVYTAAFNQSGVIRAEDEGELCDMVLALLNLPLPRGNRVAILTMGGGFGVVAAEVCEKEGLSMASLESVTLKKLSVILPPRWSPGNPVDLVGIRPMPGDMTVVSCLRLLLADRNVDCVISLLPPMATVHGPIGDIKPEQFRALQEENEKNLRILDKDIKKQDKPMVFINRLSFNPQQERNDVSAPSKIKLTEYSHPRRAARVMHSLAWYHKYLEDRKNMAVPGSIYKESGQLPEISRPDSRKLLNEVEAKELLKQAGIPVIETCLAKTEKEAISLSKEIGFPVVMKIISPDIIHKSDIGGVILGLANAAQVGRAYREMMLSVKQKQPGARVEGVSVQKMAPPGVEIIIGMNKDSQFGPVIMFGLGGVLVEVLKDVAFRLVPVSTLDAAEMVREIRGYTLLQGYRGQEPVDISRLEEIIVKISDFIENNPQIEELDINPLMATGDSIVALDARIVISATA